MKRGLKISLSLAAAIPVILYATGILAQFIININQWKAAGSNYNASPGLPSFKPDSIIHALVQFPESLIAFAILIVGLA